MKIQVVCVVIRALQPAILLKFWSGRGRMGVSWKQEFVRCFTQLGIILFVVMKNTSSDTMWLVLLPFDARILFTGSIFCRDLNLHWLVGWAILSAGRFWQVVGTASLDFPFCVLIWTHVVSWTWIFYHKLSTWMGRKGIFPLLRRNSNIGRTWHQIISKGI